MDLADGVAKIHFSHACIRKTKATWSQEAELVLLGARMPEPLPPLPNTISAGFLEVGGIRHELIPLPFKRKVAARLYLQFVDGTETEIVGEKPIIELLGRPIHLEDF
jgi:hypothetical protein